jgi:gamma-glutamyltranspeptidase/glutathione hydrolase
MGCLGANFIPKDPLWAEVYAPNGTLLQEGDTAYRKVKTVILPRIN